MAIEVGRHLNIPRENRICPHCNQNMIENENPTLLGAQNTTLYTQVISVKNIITTGRKETNLNYKCVLKPLSQLAYKQKRQNIRATDKFWFGS